MVPVHCGAISAAAAASVFSELAISSARLLSLQEIGKLIMNVVWKGLSFCQQPKALVVSQIPQMLPVLSISLHTVKLAGP